MFERKEDKLFDFAFGDLNDRDAQVFEAGLLKDPINAEEAKFLQSMKDDLSSFRDIPEMQYSKERLRDAILGQGLKPTKPGVPWLNWILAPGAMACTFALGYVLIHGSNRKDPVLVGFDPATRSASVGSKLPNQKIEVPSPVVATKSDEATGFPDVIDTHWASDHIKADVLIHKLPFVSNSDEDIVMPKSANRIGSKRRSHSTKTMVASRTIEKPSILKSVEKPATAAVLGGAGAFSAKDSASVTEVSAKSVETTLDATMILIDKEQDSGVGAPVATEVNDTRNVVIGG